MAEQIQSMKNFNRTGGKGAGAVGQDGIAREGGAAHVGQSMDEAVGNTFGQLTNAEKKQYGVTDEEWVYGARLPERWQSTEGKNRVQELARQWGYARVVKDEEGRPTMDGSDNIMVALPLAPKIARDEAERRELNRQQAYLQETRQGDQVYLEQTTSNAADDPNMVVPFTLAMKDMLLRVREQNKRNNQSTSVMGPGSPTSGGVPLSVAESRYTPEQIEAEERKYAGTITHIPMSQARWTEMKAKMDPTARNQRGQMFGFAESGFTNPNSALAQAQRNRPAAKR